ncbi:MAG: hypothetical protein JSR66_18900 [Proteobacteria bacterium]|nr:hypothetical protein [Pseudomonadota bacterium]
MNSIFALLRVTPCLCLIALSSACTKKVDWKEDVQLADGRVITLTRHQEFGGPHEIGQPSSESTGWLEFKHPDTGKVVRWDYTRDLRPVALLIDHNATELLVVPEYGEIFRRKCPSPLYFLYRYGEKGWVEKPIEDLRGRKIKRNMISTPFEAKVLMEKNNMHLSVDQTMQFTTGYTYGRRIDFGKLTTQTFEMRSCSPPFDYLPEDEEARR